MPIQTNYNYFPSVGADGAIANLNIPITLQNAPSQESIYVPRGLIVGDSIETEGIYSGFKVKLPVDTSVSADLVGVSIRSIDAYTTPVNDPQGVIYYPVDNITPYITQGEIWVKTLDNITADLAPVRVVIQNTVSPTDTYPLGTLTPLDNADTILLPGAFYFKKALANETVRVKVNIRHNTT